ncbi:hypothetical protein E4T56_gene16614 [Termitomyces sp. T112]|nr:hypothetical protein E4T56_gene16614 [Termitomyces sp. T112]
MASSSSSGNQRRRPLTKRQPLSRRNSSFLGSLKSLVTAPLAWFASTDDFEDSKDFQGKRRRLAGASSQPTVEDEDRPARNKRMRIHSPPRDESYSQTPASAHGYLDPPGSVFQQQQHRQSNPLTQPSSTRLLSVTQPYDLNNSQNNHFRASSLSRTMSIDPPPRPFSSSSATPSIPLRRDTSIDSSNLIRMASRDLSMPPLSGRPPFLMRTSMTPQPLREVSEPPPLNALNSNPTFLRAPSVKASEPLQNGLTRSSSVTLGSLMESVRRHHSPARQHSSLMVGESNRESASTTSPHPETVIEKALHELDIYKTPLVPTRLRSSNVSATTSSSNMFKSRRASNLVLMQRDGRSGRLGRKVSGKKEASLHNETKPYAGEGGMKRLLARRKQEADEEKNSVLVDDEKMDDDSQISHKAVDATSQPPMSIALLSKASQVSENTTSSVQSSSLRVGRTKTRNHIARPSRPPKMKFSAAFDEAAMDDLDEADEESIQRKEELDALEEAAKHVPVFKISDGFSFAKETKPVKIDSSEGKEPPIATLPFSFTKADNPPSSIVHAAGTPTIGSNSNLPSALAPQPAQQTLPRIPSPLPQAQPVETTTLVPADPLVAIPATNGVPSFFANSVTSSKAIASQSSTSGMPNFFATSSTLSKPINPSSSAPMVFDISSTAPSNPPVPVKDAENPLWEGESRKTLESSASKPLFDSAESLKWTGHMATAESTSTDGVAVAPITAAVSLSSNEKSVEPTLAPRPMFGAMPAVTSFSKSAEIPVPAPVSNEAPKPKPSMFASSSTSITPVPTFGSSLPSGVFGELSKVTPLAPTLLFENSNNESSAQTTPSGQTMTSTVETSKPLFGMPNPVSGGNESGGFSFGGPDANGIEQEPAGTPFLFGTTKAEQKPANTIFFESTGAKEAEQKSASSVLSFGRTDEAGQTSADTTSFSFRNVDAPLDQEPAFSCGNKGKGKDAKPANSPFSFGAAPSTPPPADGNRGSLFTFGVPPLSVPAPAPTSVGFSFSGGESDASTKPFSFGQTTRPVTPPKNQDLEVNMDESPTRDIQQPLKPADRPTIGSSGFSFGNSTPISSFGTQSNGSRPFSFGVSSTTTTALGKPHEGNPFSFGQAAPTSTAFSFGQSKPEPPRPSTTGSFSFGTPTSAAGSAPVFPFGGPSNNSTGSAFGQSQSGSAPGSPSTFTQQTSPFSFGVPLPPVNTAFSFSSQPASPAGVNLTLPQSATSGGFGNTATPGFGQPQQPSSPFGTSNPAVPTTGGATLFTIGAAPAAPSGTGTRVIRKLPNRRGGAKR